MFLNSPTVSSTPHEGVMPLTRDEARALLKADRVPIETDNTAYRLGLADIREPNFSYSVIDLLNGIAERGGYTKVWDARAGNAKECKGSRRLQAVWSLINGSVGGQKIHAEMRGISGVIGGYHYDVREESADAGSRRVTCYQSDTMPGDVIQSHRYSECVGIYVPQDRLSDALVVMDKLASVAMNMEMSAIARHVSVWGNSWGMYVLAERLRCLAKMVERWENTK